MTISDILRSVRGAFVHVFVRYGSGAEIFRPITKSKWWNTACWIMIVVGVLAWLVFFFYPYPD